MRDRPTGFDPFDWSATTVSVLGLIASLAILFLVMPSVLETLADFGGTLPFLTRAALSRGFVGGLMFVDTALLTAGVALRVTGRRAAGRGLLALSAALSVMIVFTVVAGTYLPLFTLADAIRE